MIYQFLKKLDQTHPFELAMAYSIASDEACKEEAIQCETAQQSQLEVSQVKQIATK